MGENGKKWEKIHFLQISPNFLHFYPSLRIPPPFFLALGSLWVRSRVHYPPPEPGTSEPCTDTVPLFPSAAVTSGDPAVVVVVDGGTGLVCGDAGRAQAAT